MSDANGYQTLAEIRIQNLIRRVDELEAALNILIAFADQYRETSASVIATVRKILQNRLPEPPQEEGL